MRDEGHVYLSAVRVAGEREAGIPVHRGRASDCGSWRAGFARFHVFESQRQIGVSGAAVVDADQSQVVLQAQAAIGEHFDPDIGQMLCDDRPPVL